jgi:hypothetical protein
MCKKTQISNFVKIRQVGAELFHADELMAMTKLVAAFRNLRTLLKMAHGKVEATRVPLAQTLKLCVGGGGGSIIDVCLMKESQADISTHLNSGAIYGPV